MKALFVHDNRFVKYGNDYYSYSHFSHALLWKYYLEYFDEICVVGRVVEVESVEETEPYCNSGGAGVHIVGCPDLLTLSGLLRYGEAVNVLKREIRQADAVIIRVPSMLGSIAASLARELKKPYLAEVVGCAWDSMWNYGSWSGKVIALPYWMMERRVVRQAPYAAYVSRFFLQKRYPNRGMNAALPDCHISVTDTEVLEKRLSRIESGRQRTEFRIGFIASASAGYKGHETAIKALAAVKAEIPGVKLHILGDGDYGKWMKLAEEYGVGDRIVPDGYRCGSEQVLQWLDEIDLYIMPSLQETLGRSLIEAMSRGCPALGTLETAIPEQLGNDCLFHKKDDKRLAEMIIYLYAHPEYQKSCACENFYRAQKYSDEVLLFRRKMFWDRFITDVRNKE